MRARRRESARDRGSDISQERKQKTLSGAAARAVVFRVHNAVEIRLALCCERDR